MPLTTKKQRNSYYKKLGDLILGQTEDATILGGDHNDILNKSDIITKIPNAKPIKTTKCLKKLMKQNKLIDIWKIKNEHRSQFTWRRKSSTEKNRIDFWLISKDLMPLILSTDIRPAIIQYTDHLAISINSTILIKEVLATGN